MEFFQWLWEDADKLSGIAAVLAFVIAVLALRAQREHNRLSVRPLPEIKFKDLEGHQVVTLANHGTGPLIIKALGISKGGEIVADALIDLMPAHIKSWDWFVGSLNGRSVPVGGSIDLIEYKTISKSNQQAVRGALKDLSVHVIYCDIYNGDHPVYRKSLEWFGRHD